MKICLDSDAYTRLKKRDPAVGVKVQDSDAVVMSAVVVGELLAGFRSGTRFAVNYAELRTFLDAPGVYFVNVGTETVEHYSRIKSALRSKGRPIPTNDVWIAAHVIETGSELVSGDRHYEVIDDLLWHRLTPA